MLSTILIMFLSFVCGVLYIKFIYQEAKEKKEKDAKKKLKTLNNNVDSTRVNKWVRD